MDGTTGLSTNKFKESQHLQEGSIFVISIMPIRLMGIKKSNQAETIIWNNNRPSSTRMCRPIALIYGKETKELIVAEANNLKDKIENLLTTKVNYKNSNVDINHQLIFTMIDGKVMQVLTDTKSAMTCVYCGVTPKDMNNLNLVKTKDVNIDALKYGLSPLHAYIRFFECVLHIAYRIDIQLWRVTKENKEKLESKKAKIQNDFRKDLGLIIDVPSPGGSGTSNDGNSARCFFEEYEISARIT